jgi:hypothetical protein
MRMIDSKNLERIHQRPKAQNQGSWKLISLHGAGPLVLKFLTNLDQSNQLLQILLRITFEFDIIARIFDEVDHEIA